MLSLLDFCMTLLQFVDHPADFCFRLPDHLSHEEGAMVEPLSVGVHAVRRAGVSPGKTVAIMGAGPIGEAWVTSPNPYRLHTMKSPGHNQQRCPCNALMFI